MKSFLGDYLMADFKYVKFFTIIFILIISISFVAASDSSDESAIISQENVTSDVYGDTNNEIYVDPTHGGGGDGSKDSPYNSIQSALENLDNKTSNTIILKDGIYTGEANTKVSLIGNLIVKADEGANPTIDGGQANNFWTLSDSNILLQGITFKNFKNIYGSKQGILTSSNIDNLTVSGCTFENNTYSRAMYFDYLNNTVIDGCTFQDNDAQYLSGGGVYSTYVNNLTFSNNIVQNHNVSSSYSAAVLYSNYNTNVIFTGNRLTNVFGGAGAAVYSMHDKKLKFENNYFNNVGGAVNSYASGRLIYASSFSGDLDFNNNTVINSQGSSSYWGSINIMSSSSGGNVNISGNHFENNSAGIYVSSNLGNATVFNNTFINTKGVSYLSMSSAGDMVFYGNNFTNDMGFSLSLSNGGDLTAFDNNFDGCTDTTLSLSLNNAGNMTFFANNFTNNYRGAYLSMSNSGNMTVFDNIFVNSTSTGNGGSLYISMSNSGDMKFLDNDFVNSSSTSYGGAAYFSLSGNIGQGIIENNNFTNSSSRYYGGALYISANLKNNLTIEKNNFINSLINGNNFLYGGAVYASVSKPYNFENRSTVNFNNNNFVNSSIINTNPNLNRGLDSNGGALYISSSSGTNSVYTYIVNNTFANSYAKYGGTINAVIYDSMIKNNTIINSSAENQGGFIYLSGTNNTISGQEFNNGSALQGGAIYIASNQNNIVNNTFDNNSAKFGGAIYIASNQNNIINNTFNDNKASSDAGAIFINGNDNKLIDNVFYNNTANLRGGSIYSRYGANNLIDNDTFDSNKAQIGGAVFFDYYQYSYPDIYRYNTNNNIINSRFINNEAETAGAAVLYSSNSIIANSTFIGNNATRYGSGAVSSGGKNNVIRDNLFENNTAFLYAGAIGTNDTAIINNTFKNNTAFQAGAILTINSTIANNTFSDNFAMRGINIAYVDNWKYANKSLLSGNKGLSEDTLYAYDEDQIINVYKEIDGKFYLYDNVKTTSGTFSFQGYCIEQDASIPIVNNDKSNGTWGILVNDLFFVRNSLDQSYVGDYLKVLIMKYQNYEHYNIKDLIYVFTDGDYRNSRDPIIQDVIKLAENCFTILKNGNNTIENITYPCEFYTFVNPTTRQNMIIWNCSNPIVIPTLNPSKTLVESKTYKPGDNVTFRITVTNDKNFTFHNVTIRENVPTGFSIIDWINIYYDDIERVSDNVWVLKRGLKPGEKVQFDVVLRYDYASSYPYNYIYVDSLESESQSAGVSIDVGSTGSTDLVITKVPSTYSSLVEGSVVYFDVQITNPGPSRYTSSISVRDYWSSEDYKFLKWESDYSWTSGYSDDDEFNFYYYGGLEAGKTISIRLFYESKIKGSGGNRYNYVTLNGYQNSQAYYNFYTMNTGVNVYKYVQGPNPTYVGARMPYGMYIRNTGGGYLYNAWIEEKFPEDWVYDGWSGSSDFVHVITETGAHRWIYTKPLSGTSPSITVYFNMTKAGKYTNVIVGGADNYPNATYSLDQTVLNNTFHVDKYTQYSTYGTSSLMRYTIVVYNANSFPGILNNVWFEEHFPKEFIFDHWEGSSDWILTINENGTYRWTYNSTFPSGPSQVVNIFFRPTSVGNFTNVVIAGADGYDNTTSSVNVTVVGPDIKIEKITNNVSVELGNQVSFTIRLTNVGTAGTGGMYVREMSHPGLIYDHYTTSDVYENGVPVTSNSYWAYLGNEVWQYCNSFSQGQVTEFTVFYNTTEEGFTYNLINSTFDGAYPRFANNTTFVYVPHMEVEKISLNPITSIGGNATFLIVVKNTGSSNLTNVVVDEKKFEGLQFIDYENVEGIWDLMIFKGKYYFYLDGNIPSGGNASFIVKFKASKEGNFTNYVGANASEIKTEILANDSVLVANSNIEILKITLNPEIWNGENVTFTIVVKNNGEIDLTHVTVKEDFDNETLQYISFNGDNWSYDSSNRMFTFNQTLAVNQTTSFNVTFTGKRVGYTINTVTVSASEYGNKTTSNSTLIKEANYTVEKLLNANIVTVGDKIVYTVVVTNTGNSPLNKVTVFENYPIALKYFTVNEGWSTNDGKVFVYNGPLAVGGKAILNITFNVVDGGNVTNIAVVTTNETKDNKSANNTTFVRNPKIDLQKISLNQTVDIGEEVIFTIVVTNNGNVDLNNITLNENYPSGMKFISFSGDNWTTDNNKTFKYNGLLAIGDSIELNITFNTTEQGKLTNIVSVKSNETKEVSVNNTTFVKTYKFTVEKLLLNKTVTVGDTIVYTIVVSNTGSADLHNVTVFENYPAALEFVSVNSGWSSSDNKLFVYDGVLAAGADAILNITFKVVDGGNVANNIVVRSNETEEKFTNNTTFVKDYRYIVEKIAVDKVVSLGDEVTYIFKVTNIGNSELTGINILEKYSSDLQFLRVRGDWTTDDNRTFISTKPLSPGSTSILSVTFKVLGTGNITNVIDVSTNENKMIVTSDDVISSKYSSISVDKYTVNDTVYVGEKTAFDIIVSNTGNVDLDNIILTEDYPAEIILDSYIGKGWTRNGKIFTYNGILEPGEVVKLRVVFNTTVGGEFVNEVTVRSGNVSDSSWNITKVIYKQKPTPVKPVKPVKSVKQVKKITLPFKIVPVKNNYHMDRDNENKLPGGGVVLTKHPTANPFGILLLMILVLSVISLIRVKSVKVEINNKNFLYLMLVVLLVLLSAGCAVAAEVDDSTDDDLAVSEEVIVVESADVEEVVVTEYTEEVVIESSDSDVEYEYVDEVVVESSSGDVLSSSDVDYDVYQAPQDVIVYVSPDAGTTGDGSYDNPYNSINAALNGLDSSNSNTIMLMDGTYKGNENINLSNIPGNIIIMADNNANPTIDFENTANNWNFIGSHVMLNGITFTNANNSNGIITTVGNVNNYSIVGCSFISNINSTLINFNSVSDVSIAQCNFTSNLATSDDKFSIISSDATNVSITSNKINNQQYNSTGGVVHADNVINLEFSKNNLQKVFSVNGGAVYGNNINNLNFNDNSVIESGCDHGSGGALYLIQSKGNIIIHDDTFYGDGNTSEMGGALYLDVQPTKLSIKDNIFSFPGEFNTRQGQGIYLKTKNCGNVDIVENTFIFCSSTGVGGAIYLNSNNDKINITDNLIFGSGSQNSGGSIYLTSQYSDVNLINNEFRGGRGSGSNTYITVSHGDVVIKDNVFNGTSASDRALYVSSSYGKAIMENNLFTGSSYVGSTYFGHSYDGYVSILNNKFVKNAHNSNGGSLSIYTYYADGLNVSGNEFINSEGGNGGSAYISSSYSTICNIENNKFINSTGRNGGSLHVNLPSTNLLLTGNVFENSASSSQGGSIYMDSYTYSNRNYTIKNNTIVNSDALSNGGAIYLSSNIYSSNVVMNLDMSNNRIINSSSRSYGGAIYLYGYDTYSRDSANYNFINNSITNSSGSCGGAIYTSFNNNGASNTDHFNVLNNNFTNTVSSLDAGAIYFNSGMETSIINNNFVNSSAGRNGGILYMSNSYKNCSIMDNEFINGSAKNGGAIYLIGNNYYISNNAFENNNATLYGGSIFSQKTSNDVFDNNEFVNGSAQMGGAIFIDYPQNYGASASNKYENKNITISNSEFNSNSAELGGAVVVYSDDTIVFNSTFANNNATRYGSGALVSGGKNSIILNNTFENNTAFLYGGAVGTNNSAIINNTFINNSAYQAGAILTINSTVVNNTFVGNEAKRGSSIVYLDTYKHKTKDYDTLLVNNTLPDGSVYTYNSTEILSVDEELSKKYFLDEVTGGYLYEGYCIEENASIPLRNNGTYGIVIDDLSFVRNSLDQSYVGDYLKVLFISSKLSDLYNINKYVTIFTDTEYWNSTDPFIKSIINTTKSSTFSDDNTVIINKTIYQFQTFVNPTTRQNLILMNSSVIVEIPEISISKIPDTYKAGLNDVIKYTVNVTNEKNITVHGLVVSESYTTGLTFLSIDNTDNLWSSVTSTSWKLNRELKPYESVQLVINARVSSDRYATITNTVTGKIEELPNAVTASATVNIRKPEMNVEKTLYYSKSYYPGEAIKFVITVYNSGEADANSVYLEDSYPSELRYVGFSSSDRNWVLSSDNNGRLRFNYYGIFKPGQMSVLDVAFVVKDDVSYRTSTSNSAYVYLSGLQVDSSYASFDIDTNSKPNFNVYKNGASSAYVGSQFSYSISVGSISGSINELYIDDIFPSEWQFVNWYGPDYLIHSIVGPNHHRWTFKPTQNLIQVPYYGFGISVIFKCDTPGNYTNTAVGFAKGVGNKTASFNTTIVGPILSVEKIVQNPVVYLGDQVTFTIRVNNTGSTGASNFYINELPGSGLLFDHIVDSTGKWIYNNQTSRITYNGTLNPNGSVEVGVVFNTTKQGNNTNMVQLVHGNINKYASNSTYVQNHNMTVEKWYLNFYNTYGQNTTFVVRVKNTGNMNLTDVFVEESKFDGLNYLNFTNVKGLWSVVENNGKYLFKLNGNLTPGDYAEFDVLFNTTAHGKLTNIVVAGSNETENITANASVVSGKPSIEVEKIALNKTVYVGEEVTFTINVKNTGTMPLYGLTVKEEFPDNLEYVSSTGNWVYDSKNKLFRLETALSACEPDNLESFNVTFRAVKPGNATNIINVTNDVVNETANDTVFIKDPNFKVQKVVVNKYAVPGDEVYFTVTVTNTGNMNLTDVKLKEIYPDSLEFLGIVGDWSSDDNILFKFNGVLYVGNSTELTLRFKAVKGGNATNVVEVSTNETKFNKTANDTVIIDLYDFEVEKLALNKTVMKGDNVVYTVVITNTGNKNLTQIRLVENYGAGLQFVSVSDGWTTGDNKTFNYEGSLLQPGENAILNITFKTIAGGNMTNVVVVSTKETENKSANNNTTYVINPEISVEKLTLNKTVDIGDEVQFTIVVNNTGNVDLDNITLVESYDSRLEFVTITSEGWNTTDNITFVYKDKLAVGEVAVLNITFKALEGGVAINIVEVTTNETSGDIAKNTTLVKLPDFTVEKLLLNNTVKVNDTIVYSVVVTNTGNIDLTNITVVEEYPSALEFVSNSPNWVTSDNKIFTFIGSLAPGDKAILNITFKAVGIGNATNVVTATTNETEGNKSANHTTFVRYIDYIVSKVGIDRVVFVGEETTFIIQVTNLGNVDLKGIKVYENYPSSLKYIFHQGDWDTSDFRHFTLTSSLAPGKSTTLNITFKVVSLGNITNPIDVVFEDENKTANDTIKGIKAEFTVYKDSLNRMVYVGNQSGFDIVVVNTGNIDLTNITIFENYPNGLVYDSFIGENWTQSGRAFTYSGVLKVGESVRLSLVLFDTTRAGVLINNVGVKASANNISDIDNLTDEIIEKLSNNLSGSSSNITKVNVIYPEPEDSESTTPEEPQSPDESETPVKHVSAKDKSVDLDKSPSGRAKSKAGLSLESKATGNPLMLLALMLVMLMLPLRRKK